MSNRALGCNRDGTRLRQFVNFNALPCLCQYFSFISCNLPCLRQHKLSVDIVMNLAFRHDTVIYLHEIIYLKR